MESVKDLQWENPVPAAPAPRGSKIASTASRYGPKKVYDPFAASEDDFYAPRPASESSLWDIWWRSTHCSETKKAPVPSGRPAPSAPAPASTRPQSFASQPPAPPVQRQQPQQQSQQSMSQPMWGAAPSSCKSLVQRPALSLTVQRSDLPDMVSKADLVPRRRGRSRLWTRSRPR